MEGRALGLIALHGPVRDWDAEPWCTHSWRADGGDRGLGPAIALVDFRWERGWKRGGKRKVCERPLLQRGGEDR